MPTRVYDLDGKGRSIDEREPEDVFIDAVRHAAEREPVFVVTEPGHEEFNEKVKALGVDIMEDDLVKHGAIIVCGEIEEWSELREELRGRDIHEALRAGSPDG